MQYIALDLEWNQAYSREKMIREPDPLRGEIVQIGAAKMDEGFNIVDTFKIMVMPKFYKKMHSRVKRLTKIKNSDLQKGFPFERAMEYFRAWCGEEFTFLTWGADDLMIFKENLKINGMDAEWLPAWYDIQPIFDHQITHEGRQCSLSYAMEKLGEPPFQAHDALNDAKSTARICKRLDMQAGFENYETMKRSKKNSFKVKTYASSGEAEKDEAVTTFNCSKCGKVVRCGEWIGYKIDKHMAIAKCDCTQEYLVRLRFRRNPDRTFRVSRSIYEADEKNTALYKRLTAARKKKKKTDEQ